MLLGSPVVQFIVVFEVPISNSIHTVPDWCHVGVRLVIFESPEGVSRSTIGNIELCAGDKDIAICHREMSATRTGSTGALAG